MSRAAPFIIGEADQAILIALARFHYLTAAQVSRLLYPLLNDENRYSQRRLRRLCDAQYVLRLRALPTPRYGQAPHVFTLARRGRQHLQTLGIPVRSYFRPSEEAKAAANAPFMTHTLAAIDVLIAATCLCRDYPVVCPRMLAERELKAMAVRVRVPAGPRGADEPARQVAVIPDGWFQLRVQGRPTLSIALELDRGTEAQRAWRQKTAALVAWAAGPYRERFEATNLTIAVVCPDVPRRAQLAEWTYTELQGRGQEAYAELFLFTACSPVATAAGDFFFDRCWHVPQQTEPVALLDLPTVPESEVAASGV